MPPSHKILNPIDTKPIVNQSGLDLYVQESSKVWELFCDGSEPAFVEIYNQHFQALYNLGKQYSGDSVLLKDCLQEVFITIRNKRSKLHKVVFVKAYLLKCYRNKIISEQKKKSKRQLIDFTKDSLQFFVVPSHENVLINRQFTQEQIQQLHFSMNSLTLRQREAVYHFYFNELSYVQIKEVMGFRSTKAARNLIYKSLKSLRKEFLNYSQ